MATELWRYCLLLILCFFWAHFARDCEGYRPVGSDYLFTPYEHGMVGYYGDPLTPTRERVNEGSPRTIEYSRTSGGVKARQICPAMVGPFDDGKFYCRGKEFGYCDRRSGTCFCNVGYEGKDCSYCSSTHYMKGHWCLPKKICPHDCSGGGACDYETGLCHCDDCRTGPDCSMPLCSHFHPLCEECTFQGCMKCIEGYFVNNLGECESCQVFDARCSVCDVTGCLGCTDLLLKSVKRSGGRIFDPVLPFDELDRELADYLTFGTQSERAFDEAETYFLLDRDECLWRESTACVQHNQGEDSWTCEYYPTSHCICGHSGTISFASPTYEVSEAVQDFGVTVKRTGGGFGEVEVDYELIHLSTDDADVTSSALVTASKRLKFEEGVIRLTFKVTVNEDNLVEGTERFMLVLSNPSPGASLGPSKQTIVSIIDNEPTTVASALSYVNWGETSRAVCGANSQLSIQPMLGSGGPGLSEGSQFVADVLRRPGGPGIEEPGSAPILSTLFPVSTGAIGVSDEERVDVWWTSNMQGQYLLALMLASPGGWRGEYFNNIQLKGEPAFTRVDHRINFDWKTERITRLNRNHVTIRWTGKLKPPSTQTYTFYIQADDHAMLMINGQTIIDSWERPALNLQGQMLLEGGLLHSIVLLYREIAGHASVSLQWSSPALSRQFIPSSRMYFLDHIQESPFEIEVIPGSTSAQYTFATGEALTRATSGTLETFYVYPRDSMKNLRGAAASNDVFTGECELLDEGGGSPGATRVPVTFTWDALEQRFRGQFVPVVSGSHHLTVQFEGLHVEGSPFFVLVVPGETHGPQSSVSGSDLVAASAGDVVQFFIHAKDINGNYRGVGGDVFQVYAYPTAGGATTDITIMDLENGTYVGTFVPERKGPQYVVVTLKERHVDNSPYTMAISPGPVSAPHSIAEGLGLSSAIAGSTASFKIQPRDQFENDLETESVAITVELREATPVLGEVVYNNDGSFTGIFEPSVSGLQPLWVLVDNQHIRGSPFSVSVAPGSAMGSFSLAWGGGLAAVECGTHAEITLEVHDSLGNTLTSGGSAVVLAFEGEEGPEHSVVDLGNGLYSVTYSVTVAGLHSLRVKVDGVEVLGSPFQVTARPSLPDGRRSYVDGSGTVAAVAGHVGPVTVHLVDRFGNKITGGSHSVQVFLNGPQFLAVPVRNNLDGTFDASFTAVKSGRYRLSAFLTRPGGLTASYFATDSLEDQVLSRIDPFIDFDWDSAAPDESVRSTLFSVRWEGYVNVPHSELFAFSLGSEGGARLLIDGVKIIDGWNDSRVTRIGSVVLQKGVFYPVVVEYRKVADAAQVSLQWESSSTPREIVPSAFLCVNHTIGSDDAVVQPLVQPASTLSSASTAEGANLALAVSNLRSVVTVVARDQFGNQRNAGGDVVRAFCFFDEGRLEESLDVLDNEDGTYEVRYVAVKTGTMSLAITLNAPAIDVSVGGQILVRNLRDHQISGSPFEVLVVPGQASAASSFAFGPALIEGVAGRHEAFMVQGADERGNNLTDSTGAVEVILTKKQNGLQSSATVTPLSEGLYRVEYLVQEQGLYELVVTYGGLPISGSPFLLEITPNLAVAPPSTVLDTGAIEVAANQPFELQVQLRDEFGNHVTELATYGLAAFLRGEQMERGVVSATVDDVFATTFTVSAPGEYETDLRLLGPERGLKVQFYDTLDLLEPPLLSESSLNVDVDWGTRPMHEVAVAAVACRWSGFVLSEYSEARTFYLAAQVGSRLVIDEHVVVSVQEPCMHLNAGCSGAYSLRAGVAHEVAVEFARRDSGAGRVLLSWSSGRFEREPVPPSALFPPGAEVAGSGARVSVTEVQE